MDNRREFLKKAAMLSGGTGLANSLPASIQKALAINPAEGSTYLDAEHIVFLMQENRSFDHCYGTLQGVRGFNDPRAIQLPNKNKVWAQSNNNGDTYAPFRLDLKDSNITWLGSLPHGWSDMTEARNEGKHDNWLEAKKPGRKECKDMPLTMGYFDRRDIPFYYALADAFTVCDHHFCSSLTGTTPNRLHFWTGTIREQQDEHVQANVYNSDVSYDKEASWKTFPEYLEDNDVSWKIYQNEVSIDSGFEGEEEDWLANFTDNPIEWFTQYKIRFAHGHRNFLPKAARVMPEKINELTSKIANSPAGSEELPKLKRQLENLERSNIYIQEALQKYTEENFQRLSVREKNLHEKAFSDNRKDPHYRELEKIDYTDNGADRSMQVPKGDVLFQFREDVKTNKLPTVSWIVAPSNFSDHPGSPWYGAWYLSEVMDILTQNPEVWKKTIFILNYDENDGYFDHMPPFVPPDPYRENSGKVSAGINTKDEYVNHQQDWIKNNPAYQSLHQGPIGLGFRVPLVVASPWSRGGWVNSEVCDLTSPIQFMEHFLSHKKGKKIHCAEISSFRRAVCGNLTSVFRAYRGEKIAAPGPVERIPFLESIHKAKFKQLPTGFQKLDATAVQNLNAGKGNHVPTQEKGTRPANVIPYQLHVEGKRSGSGFELQFANSKQVFGDRTAGAPFMVFSPLSDLPPRNYVVAAGDKLQDVWVPDQHGCYHLQVHGPNGFFREFAGCVTDVHLETALLYDASKDNKSLSGNCTLLIRNKGGKPAKLAIVDNAYKKGTVAKTVAPGSVERIPMDLTHSSSWYDFTVQLEGGQLAHRYAGHVETTEPGITDPFMGGVI